jgi:ketosteroid isomerase-like protein
MLGHLTTSSATEPRGEIIMALSPHEQETTQQAPRQVVDALFAAIQSGDGDGILALLSDDVEWWVAGPPEIPYAGTFRGHDEVAHFFATFNDSVDYESWEAREFIAEGETVVVVGEERWRAKPSGHLVDNPWVLVITVRDGTITRFRAYEDTVAAKEAFLASDPQR